MRHPMLTGVLAILPQALSDRPSALTDRSNEAVDDVSIVKIRGPIEHHATAESALDSYDSIVARVAEACAGTSRHVVLKIDSPGGAVSGCFETAHTLRAMCLRAGKTLTAYVDGSACSAAYALASSAQRIVAPEAGIVGSIGVIDARIDQTKLDAAMGLRFDVITSGARKGDGNPHTTASEEELTARQSHVDSLAGVFFALVADMRKGTPDAVRQLDAGLFHGAGALKAGLIDQVQTFDELLASFARTTKEAVMASKYEEARAALEEAAKGDDEDAAKAKKLLAAMDEDPKEDEPEGSAADGDEEESEEDKKKKQEEAAAAVAASAQATTVEGRIAALEHEQRASFLATRPDLPAATLAAVKDLPLAKLKAIVDGIPKAKLSKPGAVTTLSAVRGAGQGTDEAPPSDPELARLDRVMGVSAFSSTGVVSTEHTLTLGAPKKIERKVEQNG